MRRILLLNLIAGIGLAQPQMQNPVQRADRPNPPGIPGEDQRTPNKVDEKRFIKDAFLGGMTAVELGKVALQKASSDAVKQFAQKMIDDHSKVNEDLKQIATVVDISVPAALDSKHQSRVDKLSKLSGAEFDRAYIKDQLKDHQQDVKDFQQAAEYGSDPALKTFASKTLPMLQEHLSLVKDLDKGRKTSASN
jgi:putative membrane protein